MVAKLYNTGPQFYYYLFKWLGGKVVKTTNRNKTVTHAMLSLLFEKSFRFNQSKKHKHSNIEIRMLAYSLVCFYFYDAYDF